VDKRLSWLQDSENKSGLEDNRPLPEIIIDHLGGTMIYADTVDGQRLYCIRDWVYCVSGSTAQDRGAPWWNLKRVLSKEGSCKNYRSFTVDTAGGPQSVEFASEAELFEITQRMSDRSQTVRAVKKYLADAGVFVDEARRDPAAVIAGLENYEEEKAYRKILDEGFSSDEAVQWLIQRRLGKEQRKSTVITWKRRDARGKDFATLSNKVSKIAVGETATERKRRLGLADHDTPRNYNSAADQYLTRLTEMTAEALHEHRESLGVGELGEDVDDTKPIVDGARGAAYEAFSKKPRRIRASHRPYLED
jgi:hypothetical protein